MEEGQGNVQERQGKGETAKQSNSSVPDANKVLSPIGVEESVFPNGCVTYSMMPVSLCTSCLSCYWPSDWMLLGVHPFLIHLCILLSGYLT